jgi:tetratricopeptide (TPR) repeat protein
LLPADARPKQRLALTLRQAECAIRAGDLATAEQQLGPALSLARDIGDRPAEAAATRVQARLLRLQGKLEAAQAASEQAITAGIKSGDQAAWMLARIELADVYDARGDNAKALSEYKAALVQADEAVRQAAKAAGERSVRARLCNRIATLQAKTGDAATAEETLLRALDEARKDKDPQEEGRALASLGALCARRGDRARARLYADQAIDCARAAGDRLTEARQLYNLGQLAYADRDLAGAKVSFEEARGLAEKIGWQEGLTMVARALDRVGTKAAP